jgi:hypothetical protein
MAFLTNNGRYGRSLLHALAWQVILFAFAACGDPPELFMAAFTYTSVGFWVGVLMIGVRRPHDPTKADLDFVSKGLPVLVLFGGAIAMWYWSTFRGAIG